MKRVCLSAMLCALFAAASLPAADFWTTDFLQWSDKEVAKMLADSPWAAEFTVSPRGLGGAPSGLAALSRMETFTVVWRSARPVKMAVARPAPGAALGAEMQNYLDQPEPYYLISISGTQRSFGVLPEDANALVKFAGLQVKGREIIRPLEAVVRNEQGSVTILYGFPRSQPITVEDGEIEFIFQMERTMPPPPPDAPAPAAGGGRRGGGPGRMRPPEPLDIQRKFDLRKMVVNGKLEL
jgi:hypothetical protein